MPNFYKYCLAAAVLCFLLQSLGCYPGKHIYLEKKVYVASLFTPRRLTVDMIEYYKIGRQDLLRLEYFLENTLILQHVSHSGSSTVTVNRELELKRIIDQYEIVFQHNSRGAGIQIDEERFFFYRYPFIALAYVISVQFEPEVSKNSERKMRYWLEFAPNRRGEYRVRKAFWSDQVDYEDRTFTSLLSGVENYLIVDVHSIDEVNHRRRIVSGIRSDR
ncbi:MAG: hypothetical protein DKINENOH_00361 [bacterium]|nr:hypothetical protein [bacterium]